MAVFWGSPMFCCIAYRPIWQPSLHLLSLELTARQLLSPPKEASGPSSAKARRWQVLLILPLMAVFLHFLANDIAMITTRLSYGSINITAHVSWWILGEQWHRIKMVFRRQSLCMKWVGERVIRPAATWLGGLPKSTATISVQNELYPLTKLVWWSMPSTTFLVRLETDGSLRTSEQWKVWYAGVTVRITKCCNGVKTEKSYQSPRVPMIRIVLVEYTVWRFVNVSGRADTGEEFMSGVYFRLLTRSIWCHSSSLPCLILALIFSPLELNLCFEAH